MKTRLLLLIATAFISIKTYAQYAEFASYSEMKTGVYGSIAHETAESEVFDKKDYSETTWGFIKNGATFELLNNLGVKHPKYPALNMVLIKVTSDPENKYTGKTGWVHVKATTLNKRFNTNTLRVEAEGAAATTKPTATINYAAFPELKTGLYGKIEYDSGSEVFDLKDFTPPPMGSGFLKNGATFDLLNTETVKHPEYSLDMILIRVTHDPDNSYVGKVGWVYVNATTLKDKFNPTTFKVEENYKSTTNTTTASSNNAQYANYTETKTGVYGSVAHETAQSEVFDKKDFSTPTHGFIKNGATFDLLNTVAVKHPSYGSLNMILVKITYDPENKYTGKTGWLHVKATSLKSRLNATSLKIE